MPGKRNLSAGSNVPHLSFSASLQQQHRPGRNPGSADTETKQQHRHSSKERKENCHGDGKGENQGQVQSQGIVNPAFEEEDHIYEEIE